MTKEEHHVVYVSDRAYRPYVDVSAASVRHSATGRVSVHVIDVDEPEIAERIASFPNYHGSRATFAKLLIPDVLPDVDWALYLDGDTLALGDVCEVFARCDESKLIVGSRDPENFNLGPNDETPWLKSRGLSCAVKICAGVMLMNLKAMREEKVLAQCLAFFERHGIPPLNEQTALNCVCAGRIGLLPPQWGVFSMCPEDVDFTKSVIIHYPQDLPWRREKLNKLMHDFVWLWWKFAAAQRVKLDAGRAGGVGFLWRRWAFLAIRCCPWLVTWSPYLRARLRPLHGLTRDERLIVLSRWSSSAARPGGGGR